jgi:hypothetical protein
MSIRRMMLFTLGAKIKNLVQAFKERVLNTQGQFEAEGCLEAQLTQLDNQNLLDNASLIVTPNGYRETLLYAVEPNDVGTNLFLRSEEFNNTSWTKTDVSITQNTVTAPNGTLTADTLRIGVDALARRHILYQSFTFNTSTTYTTSYYLKKANHRWIQLTYVNDTAFGVSNWANFDLEDGVIGNTGTGAIATIEDVGDGWYRCSVQGTTIIGGSLTGCEIVTTNNTNSGRYPSYQSTVAEDVCYVWGAQLVPGSTITDYISTTDRAIINGTIGDMSVTRATTATRVNSSGLIENVAVNAPRIDYSNGSCPSILVEPQRTNLVLRSEELNVTPWSSAGINVTPNTIISPSGLLNADTITGDGNLTLHQTFQTNISYVSGSTYTFSVYVKKGTNDFIQISLPNNTFFSLRFANFDINTGVIGNVSAGVTASILNAGNGWYRCIVTSTASATITSTISLVLITSSTSIRNENNSLNTSVNVWGAQLEAGTNATSYIPTVASTVTRNADVITNTNASTLIGQTEGAMFVDFNYQMSNPLADSFIATISDGTLSNHLIFAVLTTGNAAAILRTSGTNVIFISIPAASFTFGRKKIVISYKSGETNLYVNGVKIGSTITTAFSFPVTINKFNLGSSGTNGGLSNTTINSSSLYKTTLTDAQAIQLTTL